VNPSGAPREVARQRIAIALDVPSAEEARALAGTLAGRCGWLKIGLELFISAGPGFAREMAAGGQKIFLDLKLHDIPRTVAGAAAAAARTGCALINVHASGGLPMMRAAAEALDAEARATGAARPALVAVTALTSLDERDLADIGLLGPADEAVLRLAHLARRAGCDGVVCSPREIARLRAAMGPDFLLVTPGIRLADSAPGSDDQRRTAPPAEALAAGASLLVVGRPVTGASDPAAALESLLDGIVDAGAATR
jgi:orotidine-5'-phosphate decarboxylase